MKAPCNFTHQHLLIFSDLDALSLNDLEVLETTQDFMLDLEVGLHAELGAFLDNEGLIFERFHAAWRSEVDDEVRAALNFEGKRGDDAAALVRRVDVEGFTGRKPK